MGSPLSPAVANFFMEDFEEKALNSAPLRPKFFFRYVDDTFIVWPHGRDTLDQFLGHMNSRHPNIIFTMEIEQDGRLPFLDILITRRKNGILGHSVYRKPTNTNLYLNGSSHHHPSQRSAVLTTLFHRARSISDKSSLPSEIRFLKRTFVQNGYSGHQISMALKRTFQPRNILTEGEKVKPVAKACLPYVSTISGKISRILKRHNIETIHVPPVKLREQLVKAKDPDGLKTPGVYRVPCECGGAYIGETCRTIETRLKEHKRHLRLGQLEKSAIAEHCVSQDHTIKFEETKILCHAKGFWDRLTKEAIEIKLEKNNFNRDSGYSISNTWKPVLQKILEVRENSKRRKN